MPTNDDPNADLKEAIKNSKQYKRIMTNYRELAVWEVESYHQEVLNYQDKRGSRDPHSLKNTPKKKIIEYASEDAAYRSRITYIQVNARKLSFRLDFLVEVLRDWVLSTYGNRIKGTVQIKNAFINSLVFDVFSFNNKLNALDDCCGIILNDIDQSQWSRKAVISVLEINARPEGKF